MTTLTDWVVRVVVGCLMSGIAALIAHRKHALSPSGASAAIVVGTVLFAVGHVIWYGTLLVFFLSSTVFSKLKHRKKREIEKDFAKSGQRDAMQVLANSGVAIGFALLYAMTGHGNWILGYLGAMATVTADTWATELGVLWGATPRHVLTGKQVKIGSSGGITWVGLLSSGAGAGLIGLCGYFWWPQGAGLPVELPGVQVGPSQMFTWPYVFAVGLAGLLGGLTDSVLGATCQRQYWCSACRKQVERKIHCNKGTTPVKGFRWMTNDAVNALSSLVGGLALIGMT